MTNLKQNENDEDEDSYIAKEMALKFGLIIAFTLLFVILRACGIVDELTGKMSFLERIFIK